MIKYAQGVFGEDELSQVKEAFSYGYFGHAYKVEEFEREVARVCQVEPQNVAAVNNGTYALSLALMAAGIGPGDEVIVPSMTFVASFQAILMAGARPVACDVNDENLLCDVDDIKRKNSPKTKAIMPVHYCGNICDMDSLLELGKKRQIRIIEDAAHCFGGTYHGRPVGNYSDIACFSFDSIKTVSCGEGGAVVSNDPSIIQRVKLQRMLAIERQRPISVVDGIPLDCDVKLPGYRCHMSNINAAIGIAQIQKLDQFVLRRREICQKYINGLGRLRGLAFLQIPYHEIVPFMFVVRVKDGRRNALKAYLESEGIETKINYIPAHCFNLFRVDDNSCPNAERAYSEILSLPLHCALTDQDVDRVIDAVASFFDRTV